jgi:5'(3')-deoxyribonucleotidase
MDGVLANNKLHYLNYYFEESGVRLDEENIFGLNENDCLPDKTAVSRYIHTPGFFRTLPVSTDAQDVVRELQKKYDVFVVSAAMEFPHSLLEKRDWLDEHFPFITWKNIVFCGDKSIINTNFLIDDHVKNLMTFSEKGLLFDAFHNVHESQFERLKHWKDVYRYFLE